MHAAIMMLPPGHRVQAVHSAMRAYVAADRPDPSAGPFRWYDGRALAPIIPQRAHTMRGPNVGTGTLSGHGSTLMIASW